jgi:signal transduction histidine kinase
MSFRQLILIILFSTQLLNHAQSQTVEKGLVHFNSTGLLNHEVLKLTGPWQFYYGKHLSATEMENLPSDDTYFINAPSNWRNLKRHGKNTPVLGIATYYLKIVVDTNLLQKPGDYAFRVGDITSAYTMFVNDIQVMSTGKASPERKGFKAGYFPHTGSIHTDKDTLKVIIHVSNFFYPHFSGISRNILFGQEAEVNRLQIQTTVLSIFLLCIFGILFFFELMVYIANPMERSHLLVSLLAFIILVKMLLDNELTIFHFFPDFNYYLGYRFWMLTLLTIPILYSLIKLSFPNEMHRLATFVVHIIYGVTGLAIMVLPLPFLLNNLMYIIYFSITSFIYLFYVMVRAVLNKRKYALAHFLSFSVAMACILYDLIMITDPNKVNFISQIGISLYLMTQTSIILIRFIQAHKLTLKLTVELEETNQSLEAMVEKRTQELQLTNSKLEKINNQKNFMLATTTHDLKNSFNILLNCSDILNEDKTLTHDQQLYSAMIREASRNGYRVLQNILSWARMQITDYSGTNVIRDFRGLAVMEVDTFKYPIKDKNVHVRVEVDNNLLFICDEEQLYSICRNLLSNAIKFSQNDGTIIISNKEAENMVEICIHDDGIGMEPQMVDSIFDNTIDNKRRGTSGESGSGLGLIIVKELVESNKGTISCNSAPGKGTDFLIRFPRFSD